MNGWPEKTRYPRSLAEAFPDERAGWCDLPEPRTFARMGDIAVLVLIVIVIGLSIAGRLH